MTDKEQILCKYKFQNKEKFDGKPYCTCFNELCEDLSFACDHNCQIYEDFKQLARKTQECENLKEDYKELKQRHNEVFQEFERLKIECEELKDFARREGNQREIYYKEFLRTNSALEEIEEYVKSQLDGFGNDVYVMNKVAINHILGIINEIKEK